MKGEGSLDRRAGRGSITAASALLSLTVMSACSTGLPLEANISATPSSVLELSWAKAKRTSQDIEVEGQIQQIHCCRYVRGYIHVAAKDADGVDVASTNTSWGEFNPRQLHSAWFKAVLPMPTGQAVSTIDIQFSIEPRR